MTRLDNFTDVEELEMDEMQYMRFFTLCNFRPGLHSENEFYKLSDETILDDSKYAGVEEKQCAGHIVRKVGKGLYSISVIRDDGTVWGINLGLFKSVTPLDVIMKEALC